MFCLKQRSETTSQKCCDLTLMALTRDKKQYTTKQMHSILIY